MIRLPEPPLCVFTCIRTELTFSLVSKLVVLGCLLSKDPDEEPDHRLQVASSTFWRQKDFFLFADIPTQERMEAYALNIQPVVLFSAACWHLTARLARRLLSWETGLLLAMCATRRHAAEEEADFFRRRHQVARRIFHRGRAPAEEGQKTQKLRTRKGILTLTLLRMQRLVGNSFMALGVSLVAWADMVFMPTAPQLWQLLQSFLEKEGPARLGGRPWLCLAASVLYRSELWWQSRQHVGLAIDARNSQGWRHSRPGPHRRWERPIAQSLGIDWMNIALDTAAWNAVAETFVQRCHRNWGIKRMETEHGLAPTTTPASAPEKKGRRHTRLYLTDAMEQLVQ